MTKEAEEEISWVRWDTAESVQGNEKDCTYQTNA